MPIKKPIIILENDKNTVFQNSPVTTSWKILSSTSKGAGTNSGLFIQAAVNCQIKSHKIIAVNLNIHFLLFKVNVILSGPRKGKTCDHGTGFDIQEKDLLSLYDYYIEVKENS